VYAEIDGVKDLPAGWREEFERLFSARRMAEDYLHVYNDVIEGPGEAPAVKANAQAAAVATWKAPPDVPGRRLRP
jgi:hypothetical protein